MAAIEASGWPSAASAANIEAMKNIRKSIGMAIALSGFCVLASGLF